METTDDVEKPLSESQDSDSTDETIGIDNHKQPRKQKGQKKYNEMHPGWWPQRYAPSNGANRSIRAGMREKIRQYEEAGRDPRDMWDELTKATLERVQLPFTITKPGRNRVRRAKRRKRNCSPSYQGDSNENVDARSPSGFTSVDDDAASSQPKLLADSVRRTIARLNGDFMLRSDDISRCTKLLHPADEWHIFYPGYPSENSVLQRLRTRANNLVFFLHAKCHWSLCHLDRKSGQLNHFNSMRHTEMPDCPQQEDAFNCGIFALAFLQSLVNGEGIPTQVNARELRTFFAMHIEGNGPPEREITVQETTSTSCQTPPELINPVNRSVSLPADSSIPASFLAESQNFLKSWRREKGRLAMVTKTFEQKATKLSTLEDELTLVRQRLQKSEETVRELRKQIKESGDTETLHNDIRDLIAKLPPAEGSNFHSKWLSKLRSNAEMINDSMLAESKSLPKRLSNAESELDGTRKRVTQLEGQIQLRRMDLEGIGNEIEKTKQDLTYISEEYAQIEGL
ncbi:hypothetical protein BFJ70_g15365 [Fusarium oxysporum]|uniref:Uncharacterized protein n=3 Tax=Fusarium oxysporum TaxID=5507 RepID=A0A420RF47_FUSOX|nr:hypothetical protein BFJ66_g12966 [Fusarium oxysporum f. sp. cepae]RKK68460.1 hypothetical protein BFJ69_g13586 [Fusarium oxysporum]RKL15642.1 hypothetical protein BFJ70_g15365 [Fusarium oxysporum]